MKTERRRGGDASIRDELKKEGEREREKSKYIIAEISPTS